MKFSKGFLLNVKQLIQKNPILLLFLIVILFVVFIAAYKVITAKKETVYVKVKVSQGLWWASTLKPSFWLADALHKGDIEVNLAGKPVVEVIEVRKYPLVVSNPGEQYDVFLTVKLAADYNDRTQKYSFKRADILIGSPIEFELKNIALTGTVMAVSDKPFEDQYEEKIVTLQKEFAQEWEYEAIIEGDTYSDGEDVIIEVLEKNITDTFDAYNSLGVNYPVFSGRRINMNIIVKMKLKKQGNAYLFKEEVPMANGRRMNLPLTQFVLNDFIVESVK